MIINSEQWYRSPRFTPIRILSYPVLYDGKGKRGDCLEIFGLCINIF